MCISHICDLLQQLCDIVGPDIMDFSALMTFFKNKWAPAICSLHTPGGDILSTFLSNPCQSLTNLSTQEVCYNYKGYKLLYFSYYG